MIDLGFRLPARGTVAPSRKTEFDWGAANKEFELFMRTRNKADEVQKCYVTVDGVRYDFHVRAGTKDLTVLYEHFSEDYLAQCDHFGWPESSDDAPDTDTQNEP